jgi:hypothetical protein
VLLLILGLVKIVIIMEMEVVQDLELDMVMEEILGEMEMEVVQVQELGQLLMIGRAESDLLEIQVQLVPEQHQDHLVHLRRPLTILHKN